MHDVFFVISAATIATQRRDKHAFTTIEVLCFLREPCRGVIIIIFFL
jgi:hypothetical protein